jgi:hypothetical protein
VGTASGTVCAYGENFQYTTLSESESLKSRPVRKLVAFGTDNLLIGYEGCGLELVSLPTIAVTRYLEVGWNDASIEDLSALQVDDRTEGRIFVYVGTTAGNVYVIDMSGPAVCARVSDYVISYVESGFDPHTSVIATDIQLSPKVRTSVHLHTPMMIRFFFPSLMYQAHGISNFLLLWCYRCIEQ